MKVLVNEQTCEHHGQCEIVCPEVFELIGTSELRHTANPDESLRADAEAAADACPTASISIVD